MDQDMQNGLPAGPVLQNNPYMLNNGLGSSQSSRDASPVSRFGKIPASQLPPSRQVPAGRPSVSPIMGPQKGGPSAVGAAVPAATLVTPQSSPRIANFNTSTPIMPVGQQPLNLPVRQSFSQPNTPRVVPPASNMNQRTDYVPNSGQLPPSASSNQHSQPEVNVSKQTFPAGYPPNAQQTERKVASPSLAQSSVSAPHNSVGSVPPGRSAQLPVPAYYMQQPRPNLVTQAPQVQQVPQVAQPPKVPQAPQAPQAPQVAQAPQNLERNFGQTAEINENIPPQAPPKFEEQKLPPNPAPQQIKPFAAPPADAATSRNYEQKPQVTTHQVQPAQNTNYQNAAPASAFQRPQPNYQASPMPPVQNQYSNQTSIHAKRYPQQNYPQQNYQQNYQQNTQSAPMMQSAPQSAPQSVPQSAPQSAPQNYQTAGANAYSQPYAQPNTTYSQGYQKQGYQRGLNQQMGNLSVTQSGFNKLWGAENYDLLSCNNVLPTEPIAPPRVRLGQDFLDAANCSPEIFRCTMTKIPESKALLRKSRLPLGVLIHPFKDLSHLPVIQCNTIVRCRACRTYINPFVFFVDTKRWKCNLCYRINELPEEFQYDPVSKSYGDPSRRPEIKSSTIEYIAPSEYMLRPPQPAVYLFLLDISRLAVETGYLQTVCDVLSSQLSSLPGDARTQVGFLAYNSTLHFFSLAEGLNQPHEMIVMDIDDIFLPCLDNLLVNLKECKELVIDLLAQLPTRYDNSYDTGSALGAALEAAFKMMSSTGGRITVFQTCLPSVGPGVLVAREDPNQRSAKEVPHLNPATDFYKRLALDCSGQQVAVDLFILNSQYVDIATLSGISRFSGGCIYHFPLFKVSRRLDAESLERCFRRYLSRKIGFEAVMRIRCTRGLAIHTFYGNFFVRSTDLLSLPNVNPDAGFGMQVSIEESLTDLHTVCFQAALLYTSSKGERRIRVHTLCLPVVSTLTDILNSADQQCIVGLLAKLAVDRSQQSNLSDARDAFINVAIDILSSYKMSLNMGNTSSGLLAPESLKLLPLYILALLKHLAFRTGQSTRLDDRVFAMCEMKTLPLAQLLQSVYPDLYPVHCLTDEGGIVDGDEVIPQPPRLQLSSRNIDSNGAYLLDAGELMIIMVCPNVSPLFLTHSLGVASYNSITDQFYELPKLENADNQRLHMFVNSLNAEKPYNASLQIMRENSPNRMLFMERLVEDRQESALSYNEFLQHIKTQVK